MPILRIPPEWQLADLPFIREDELPFGVFGNLKTVELMKAVARMRSSHPKIRKLALKILEYYKIPSNDYLKEAWAIGEFVKSRVRYTMDCNGVEQVHDPVLIVEMISQGIAQADCDDMALLVATLLLAVGHEPFYRAVRYRGRSGPFNHIYVVAYEKDLQNNQVRLPIDAIVKKKPIGFEVPHASGEEFAI